jgi:hypothetical protein
MTKPSTPTPPRPAARPRGLRLLLCGALLVGACTNPFKPADPEPPDATAVPEDFSSPEALLQTMSLALSSRSTNGATAYMRAYAESTVAGDKAYRAFYDAGVKGNWQVATQLTAPEPWDIQLEVSVHATIAAIRPNFNYLWQWDADPDSPIDDNPDLSDTVVYHRKYTLYAAPENGEFEVIAIGFADIAMQKKEGPRWSIYRWVDRVDPDVGVNPANTDERTMSWWRLESLTL